MGYDKENWKLDRKGKDYIYIGKKIEDYNSINQQLYKLVSTSYLKPLKNIETECEYEQPNNTTEAKVSQVDKIDINREYREIYTLLNGFKHGIYKQYYIQKEETPPFEKELLIVEANYYQGKLDGKCTIWYPFGEARIIKEMEYKNGELKSEKYCNF